MDFINKEEKRKRKRDHHWKGLSVNLVNILTFWSCVEQDWVALLKMVNYQWRWGRVGLMWWRSWCVLVWGTIWFFQQKSGPVAEKVFTNDTVVWRLQSWCFGVFVQPIRLACLTFTVLKTWSQTYRSDDFT